jgi:hypothetical protein
MHKIGVLAFVVALLAGTAVLSPARVLAQTSQPAQPTQPEEKMALYTKYYEKRKGDAAEQKAAYELGQEFLKKYGADDDQYVKAVKKFIEKYEELDRGNKFIAAMNAKDYGKAFETGTQILQREPENFAVMVQLVKAGYLSSTTANNKNFNAQSMALAKKALELLDTNKVTDPAGMPSLDDARGYLNYCLGWFLHDTSPTEAVPVLLKAINASTAYKTNANTYYLFGTSILNGEYQQQVKEYQDKYAGKDESPEQKAALERISKTGDRAVDAMARAVALSSKPEQEKYRNDVLAQLTDVYKDLHKGSDEGLKELIDSVLSKPMP